MKSILDSAFQYTQSAATDLRKTFARERRRIRERQQAQASAAAEAASKVSPLVRKEQK